MSDSAASKPNLMDRWTRLSLARRIMLAAAIWGFVVLIGGAIALSAVYRAQTLSLLEEDLEQTLVGLTREMTRENAFLEDGRVTDSQREFFAGDVRFRTQYSGRYWAIVGVNSEGSIAGDIRSRSLWDEPVPLNEDQLERTLMNPGLTMFGNFRFEGPAGQRVRVASRAILIENRETPLILVTAADRAANDAATSRFRNLLLVTMIALFGGGVCCNGCGDFILPATLAPDRGRHCRSARRNAAEIV